jgi:hypothetical protein
MMVATSSGNSDSLVVLEKYLDWKNIAKLLLFCFAMGPLRSKCDAALDLVRNMFAEMGINRR